MQPFHYFQIVNLVDCLSSWYKSIMNNPSNIKKSATLFWLLNWTDGIILFVRDLQSSIVQFSASFQGRIGRPIFHHRWWHGPKCHLASPEGLGKLWLLFKLRHSLGGTTKHTQTVTDATQKETAIDQKHSYETLISQHHQTILRLLSSAATASTRWRVRELNCTTKYIVPACDILIQD